MYILPISIILIACFLGILLLYIEKNKSSFKDIKIKKKKIKRKDEKKIKIYHILISMPLLRLIANRCIRIINTSTEVKERNQELAVDITLKSLFVFVLMSLAISPFITNIRILITALIGLCFITISTVDYFSGKVRTTLLIHLIDLLDILRNKYFESGNRVDDALRESILSLDINRHFDIIDEAESLLETIEHPDKDLALRDYYQIAPNKYFILLAGLLFINKENGDLIDEKGSRFSRALTDLNSELKDEIRLRDKLNFSLKSLNIIAIIPLFIISPLRIWASESFYPLQKFYNSSLGFLTEFIVLVSVILSFIGISKIQHFKEDLSQDNMHESMNTFYKKFKKIVDFIAPRKNSKRYLKVTERKEAALEFTSLEIFYTKKIVSSIIFVILSLVVSLYISTISTRAILENPTFNEGYLGGEVDEEDLIIANKRSEMDKEMILLLENGENSKEIVNILKEKYGLIGEEKNIAIERIIQKYSAYEKSKFNYKNIIIIYMIGLCAFFIPNILLSMRKRIIKIDAMNEVSKFQLICTLMMHIKEISIDTLLEWLERFSLIYKIPIQNAIMDYDAGSEKALLKLKQASQNDEFRKIVEHMLSAVNRISIEKAFDDLEIEKNYYKEKRRVAYERIVDKKISLGRIVGFIPTYSVILIYFMLALIYSSTKEMDVYFRMFTQ